MLICLNGWIKNHKDILCSGISRLILTITPITTITITITITTAIITIIIIILLQTILTIIKVNNLNFAANTTENINYATIRIPITQNPTKSIHGI